MVKSNIEEQSPAPEPADFEKRHEQDLSVKRFTYTQGKLVLIPIAGMGIGGLIGYHTLGRPLASLFPRFFRGVDTTHEVIHTISEAVAGEPITKKQLNAAKWAGAAVLGFVGSVLGSIFVGYDKWRKDESARLAANEIERDISKMELFRPSDPELVAENKRLRGMIAETEKDANVHHKTPHHEGAKHEKPEAMVDTVEHHGKTAHHAEHQLS